MPMHPLIALWCHPRSMSTAMERMMRARGDVACVHEPFMYHYYLGEGRGRFPHFQPEPGRPRDYEAIRDALLARAADGPAFFKDMSYYVVPRILSDTAFTDRVVNVFLVRDPRRSIASYSRLDPGMSLDEIGVEALWRHAAHVADRRARWPLVLEAERVQADPARAAALIAAEAGLPEARHALDLGRAEKPADWEQVEAWHGATLAHDRIRPASELPDADAVFRRAAEANPRLRALLAHHWPFYERLAAKAA